MREQTLGDDLLIGAPAIAAYLNGVMNTVLVIIALMLVGSALMGWHGRRNYWAQ